MNLKRHSEKLEKFLKDEFKSKTPIAVMPDGNVVYNNFKIIKNKNGTWSVYRIGGSLIETFFLRATALMAAKCWQNSSRLFNEILLLDRHYSTNIVDSQIFMYRFKNSTDSFKKEVARTRWEITNARADNAKRQIASRFRQMF